jgi:4-diphosphocytidyl-2-C-methyl-D-erythritol kinase
VLVKAFAKINLGLKIYEKYPDGFHELTTIFAKIGIFDSIELRPRNDNKICVKTLCAEIPEKENLVFRAAWLLQKFCARPLGVEIILTKKIPISSGLGGGSANAAAVLRGLKKLWQIKIPILKLARIGSALGADVPQFLFPGILQARGRGDIFRPIKLPQNFPREVLLVCPPIKIPTVLAFKKFDQLKIKKKTSINFPDQKKIFHQELVNDFEKVFFRDFPELRKIKNALKRSGSELVSLSGSGSAIFGLFSSREVAERMRKKFEKCGKVFLTRIRGG